MLVHSKTLPGKKGRAEIPRASVFFCVGVLSACPVEATSACATCVLCFGGIYHSFPRARGAAVGNQPRLGGTRMFSSFLHGSEKAKRKCCLWGSSPVRVLSRLQKKAGGAGGDARAVVADRSAACVARAGHAAGFEAARGGCLLQVEVWEEE